MALAVVASGCGGGSATQPLPLAKVNAALVPTDLPSSGIKLYPNTDPETVKAFASAGDHSLVADARLWELRQADRLVGALQVATVIPKLDLSRAEHRNSILRQIMPATVATLTVANVEVSMATSNDKVVYVWFADGVFEVLQLKGSKLIPDEVLTQVLAFQTASDAWHPVPVGKAKQAK
jgi:hypothetical protein